MRIYERNGTQRREEDTSGILLYREVDNRRRDVKKGRNRKKFKKHSRRSSGRQRKASWISEKRDGKTVKVRLM